MLKNGRSYSPHSNSSVSNDSSTLMNNKEFVDIKYKLSILENEVKSLQRKDRVSLNNNQEPQEDTHNTNSSTKIGYANINSGVYFMELFDYKQETCVFTINFKGEDRGEFDIISLDKLKSRNGWQEVVEATGNCTLAEANEFTRLDCGKCRKIDSNVWEVTQKLKIKIRK